MQRLCTHFWSNIIQTPFQHCPVAIVVGNPALMSILPMMLKLHHYDRVCTIEFFDKASQALHWLKTRDSIKKTPVTFSAIV
jgi:hypothetical protein